MDSIFAHNIPDEVLQIVVVLYNYGISYVTNFTGEAKNSLETSV